MADSGIKMTGGLTVADSGLVVTANGVSITGGMKVANGVTISDTGLHIDSSGFRVTGGLSIRDSLLRISGGLTLSDTGLDISSDGGTISAGGLTVNSGLTITSNTLAAPNMIVTGGLSAKSGGVVTGGLSVTTSGLKTESTSTNYVTGDSHIIGTLCIANNLNGNFVATSDRRLKTEVTPVRDSLDSITKLRGVHFNWTKDSPQAKFRKTRQMGLIAQDVQKLFPELVQQIMDGEYLGVNYAQLIPVMIEAIRELDESYTALEEDYRKLGDRSRNCPCRNKRIP